MQRGFSIVIAAHNEAAVIEQTLRSAAANRVDRPVQVVVVANGCTDDTAARAKRAADELQRQPDFEINVLETPIGNKIHALNLGDRAAKYFPRAYLDADVELSPNLIQEVISVFESDSRVRIVAPGCRHIYTGRNPFLAGYYKLWSSLPYVQSHTMARGFFAVDQQLRERFAEFPAVTADDKFVRNLTRPDERRIAASAHTRVYMPTSFRDLLRVKTRWTYGNLELAERRPDLNENDGQQHQGAGRHVLMRPWLWIHVPAFLFVYWYSHREARRRLREKQSAWERAESSRGVGRAIG